jgi:hypothetical protein
LLLKQEGRPEGRPLLAAEWTTRPEPPASIFQP